MTGYQDTYVFRDWQIRELQECNVIGRQGEHAVTQSQTEQSMRFKHVSVLHMLHIKHVNENAAKKNKKSNSDFNQRVILIQVTF